MAKKKWTLDRKWDKSKEEKHFETMLADDGYEVKGIREYTTKTDYLIEKDGIEQEYSFPHIGGGISQARQCMKCFVMYYNTTKEYLRIKGE